jgi:hypothetical protein
MKEGTSIFSFVIANLATAMAPPGLVPLNTENMTAFFYTSKFATNVAPIAQAGM